MTSEMDPAFLLRRNAIRTPFNGCPYRLSTKREQEFTRSYFAFLSWTLPSFRLAVAVAFFGTAALVIY